jgi:hypothetical protein
VTTPNVYLFELEDVIADRSHRLHYFKREEFNRAEYDEQGQYDQPITSTALLIRRLVAGGGQVWIWSHRPSTELARTQVWLHRYDIPYSQLLLQPHDSDQSEQQTKDRWLREVIPADRVVMSFAAPGMEEGTYAMLRTHHDIQILRTRYEPKR